ncbi:hypothetical protein [Caviibacterium pharyngocola]|uniref:Uncharacterized protein n=1 Tax=Caviibacterium pharyngocola TaxID=28159 RepID=A0A2M8RTD4_9PAST|nr:hypothetical protein [Caviibacterium pharyngocola]PJG82152.1 hypothetical protein CVP04_10880 [Caviibacterium pharyngocola]
MTDIVKHMVCSGVMYDPYLKALFLAEIKKQKRDDFKYTQARKVMCQDDFGRRWCLCCFLMLPARNEPEMIQLYVNPVDEQGNIFDESMGTYQIELSECRGE